MAPSREETIKISTSIEKVKTKEEMIYILNSYKNLLSKEIYEYLEGLINLDYSVIRDYITVEDKKRLGQLDLFRTISIYNIYNRAIKIANDIAPKASIYGNEERREGLDITAEYDEQYIPLFNFNYSHGPLGLPRIHEDTTKLTKVGTITLYESIDARIFKNELKIKELEAKVEILTQEKNPYGEKPIGNKNINQAKSWKIDQEKKISELLFEIEELKTPRNLSSNDKKEIKRTRRFSDAILNDYGLTRQDFEKTKNGYLSDTIDLNCKKETPNIKILRKIEKL